MLEELQLRAQHIICMIKCTSSIFVCLLHPHPPLEHPLLSATVSDCVFVFFESTLLLLLSRQSN